MSENLLNQPVVLDLSNNPPVESFGNTSIYRDVNHQVGDKNGRQETNIVKLVRTTPEIGRQLQGNEDAFRNTLTQALKQSGLVDASITTGQGSPENANGQYVNNVVGVRVPTNSDPIKEAFNRGAVHSAMNVAMYAHGYGENLGIEGVQKTGQQGWTTNFQQSASHANTAQTSPAAPTR